MDVWMEEIKREMQRKRKEGRRQTLLEILF